MSRVRIALLTGAIALLATGVARAQAPDAGAELLRRVPFPDAAAWWAAEGLAGYAPDTEWLGVSYPWVLAGLVRGGWSFDDPVRMPGALTGPGIPAAHAPLSWYDSLEVRRIGGAGAWQGFEAAMAPVTGRVFGTERATQAGPRTVSMFSFARGSSAAEDNLLALAHTDSLSAFRYEVASGQRGAVGVYQDAGAHRYGLLARIDRGGQRFEGRFAHRGAAISIASDAAWQSAMGAGGAFAWSLRRPNDVTRIELRRITDWHESDGWAIGPSRRDQSEEGAEATWTHGPASAPLAFRGAWWRSHVRRNTLGFEDEDDKASGWWLAARGSRPLGHLAADGSVGLGAQDGTGGLVVAPSLGLGAARGTLTASARVERIATPVWTDLEPGTAPFLQDTWTAALALAAGDSARHARLTGRIGRTQRRALALRLPLEELWLRAGYEMDPEPYRFALACFEGAWGGRGWGLMLEGFALARTTTPLQSAVDPVNGLRATLGVGRRFFKNELDTRVRVTGAVIGERQSEDTSAWLDAYPTFTVAGVFTLSDATLVVEAIGLEDQPHPLVWVDPYTGQDALGPGMETRVSFSWRLFN